MAVFNERDYQAFKELIPGPGYDGVWARVVTGLDAFPVPVKIIGDTELTAFTPTIYNVSAPLAGTEYSQILSDDTKQFTIRARGLSQIQLSFVSGDSGLVFLTIPPGCNYSSGDLQLITKTIYFQTSKPAETVEIIEWKQ